MGKEKLEASPWDLLEKEGQLGNFGEETLKGKNSEKIRKGPATNVANITLVLVPRATNGGN